MGNKERKGKIKKFFGVLGIGLLAFGTYKTINTLEEKDIIDIDGGIHLQQAEEPNNVVFENNILSWTAYDGTDEYVIKCDGNTYKTTENSYDFSELEPGVYDIKIKATEDGKRDSSYVKLDDCVVLTEEQIKEKLVDKALEVIKSLNNSYENYQTVFYEISNDKLNMLIKCKSTFKENTTYYLNYAFDISNQTDNISDYITENNAKLEFETELDNVANYFTNVNYENIPLFGNLKTLENNGWDIEKIVEHTGKGVYNYDTQYLYGNYVIIAKCTKGDEVKYIYQSGNFGHTSTSVGWNELQYLFEKGDLNDSLYQTEFVDFGNPEYINNNALNTNELTK